MRMRNVKRGKRRLWEKKNMCMVRKKEGEGEEKEEEGEYLGCIWDEKDSRKVLEVI